MLVKEFLFYSTCLVRNENFLKMRVSEIRVKLIRVNQGLGVFLAPPCAHHVIFITEFVLLTNTPPFHEVNSFNRKWLANGGISKIYFFSRPLFTNIFRSEMQKFPPYSILTG